LDTELITTEEVPCASTIENGAIESTVDLPELQDIGRHVDVRITDDKFKYDLLKNPWLPSSKYNFCWVERHDSLLRFKEIYLPITNTLRELEQHHNLETSKLAFQLSKTITSSSFVISLYNLEKNSCYNISFM